MAKQVALVDECGVAYAMSVLGGKWKMAIIWKLLGGTMRFAELRRQLVGVAEGVLITQLKELERDGLVVRRALERVPPHVEYSVSERTRDLEPALRVLDRWGDLNRPPELLNHPIAQVPADPIEPAKPAPGAAPGLSR